MKTHRRSWLAGIAPLLYCILAPIIVYCLALVAIGAVVFIGGAMVVGIARLFGG